MLCQDDGILLHLSNPECISQRAVGRGEKDFRRAGIVRIVGSYREIMGVGRYGTGIGFRNPARFGKLYFVVGIAAQFHLDGLAASGNKVFLLAQYQEGGGARLVNGNGFR